MADDIIKGSMPRWQNESNRSFGNQHENVNASKILPSYDSTLTTTLTAATLAIASNKPERKRSPVNFQGKSPGTTGSQMSNGDGVSGGDRFIPNRASSILDSGNYTMTTMQQNDDIENELNQNYRNVLSEAMQLNLGADVFSYRTRRPLHFIENKLPTNIATKSKSRHIPNCSERMLDAPEINNNFYLNLLDWSASNIVAVPLGKTIYCWNGDTADVQQLCEYKTNDDACSLAWIHHGPAIAIGLKDGTIELWDAEAKKRLRVMDGHAARVGSLAWNSHVLSSGSRDRSIIHHDVRVRDHHITTLSGHTQEVCGLKWSTDFKYLASGGNDNLVNIWPALAGSNANANDAIFQFNQHRAAIHAIAWCPWQPNILATGGGAVDRSIKLWNINNGLLINSVDAKSQVPALQWSKTYREIISAHGYPDCQLTLWKYPSMKNICELIGHEERILHMAMSPDGSTIVSAAADETLRIWRCFAPDIRQANKKKSTANVPPSLLRPNIR